MIATTGLPPARGANSPQTFLASSRLSVVSMITTPDLPTTMIELAMP